MTGHEHGRAHSFDTDAEAARLEREAEGLLDDVERAVALLADVAREHGVDVRRVLDVGCGPGVATCVLAQRFPSARVVAVDSSSTMLDHASARVARLGLAPRVETRRVDLPEGLDTLGAADLAWASMVLHHVDDERAALRSLRHLLRPRGLLAVVEHAPVPGGQDRFAATLDGEELALVADESLATDRRLYVARPRRA